MKLFLDCEFTDFQGQLMSIALVSERGDEFYYVIQYQNPSEWVKANVVPHLGLEPQPIEHMRGALQVFLERFSEVEIIADWPEDISFFCNALITGPGTRINTPPLTMKVIREIDSAQSRIPHNALEDARAIAEAYKRLI